MENTFLPADYVPPTSNYLKFEDGENRFRVMSSAIIGFEYWTTENKPVRSRTSFKETPNIKTDQNGRKEVKPFWAFIVWSNKNKKIMILEITQKTIQQAMFRLVKNEDWGDPKNYDIIINREEVSGITKYNVVPCPHKEVSQNVSDAFNDVKINLEALYDGADPFSDSAPIAEQHNQEQPIVGHAENSVAIEVDNMPMN